MMDNNINKLDSRAEKRFSIRSLPQGQFNKYRQMFDSFTRRNKEDTNQSLSNKQTKLVDKSTTTSPVKIVSNLKPVFESEKDMEEFLNRLKAGTKCDQELNNLTCNDLEKFEIEMDKIFDGVSDETNLLLNNLCISNKQIADFLIEKQTNTTLTSNNTETSCSIETKSNETNSNQLNDMSISSFLSESSSLSSTGSNEPKNKLNNSYSQNIFTTLQTDNQTDLAKISQTIQEPYETRVTYMIETDRDENLINDTTKTTELSSCSLSISSSSDNTKPDTETNLMASTISTIEANHDSNYLELDDIEFSDESYHEEEAEDAEEQKKIFSFRVEKTVTLAKQTTQTPPPKPARTFEHDIYIQKKALAKSKELFHSCIISTENSNSKQDRLVKTKSLYSPNDHIYETLPTMNYNNDNNQKDVKNSKKLIFGKKLNKNKEHGLSHSKLTNSEPNLNQIGYSNKKLLIKPFEKLFNHFKKTLSRKNLNEISVETNQLNSKQNLDGILRNKCLNKNTITKSYIYSDINEFNSKLQTLFDFVLIVGIKDKKTQSIEELDTNLGLFNKSSPTVIWKYPNNEEDEDKKFNKTIPEFCFPDLENQNDFKKNESEIFQFTLTNIDGKRTYGYCIRLCQKNKSPIVICIISEIDALEMYYTILIESEQLYKNENLDGVKSFLSSIYPKSFPNRGESLLVTLGIDHEKEIILNRSLDRRLEHINLYTILNYSFDFIIKIFSSMLAEKKIIFLSSKLSSLSSIIQAFETVLYPFNWPHTYIPVLPSYLIEMTEAPTPYIIGLMKSCKNELLKYKGVTDMLIVDLDKQKFVQENHDESKLLPEFVLKTLKYDLINLTQNSKLMSDYEKNVELCKIFLKVFLRTVGNYKDYITLELESDNQEEKSFKFLYKKFINDAKTQEMREFLDVFVNSQLFEVFINKKLNPEAKFGLMFDEAIKNDSTHIQTKHVLNSPKTTTIKQLKTKDKFKKQRF